MKPTTEIWQGGNFSQALLQSGTQFFKAMCEAVRAESGAHLVLIGSLKIAEAERIEILGLSADDPNIEVEWYDALPAPCLEVLNHNRIAVHLEKLNLAFPEDGNIQAIRSKSYIGFPLTNSLDSVVGILALEWGKDINRRTSEEVQSFLAPLLPRIETEVVEHNVAHAFNALINPVDNDPEMKDAAIFRSIVQQAAEIAQVHGAVLTKCVDRGAKNFKILAAIADGELLTEAEGALMAYEGTPCSNLTVDETFFQARDLQKLYPNVGLFRDLDVQSYCGFGFRDRDLNPIGHLAFLHNRPMAQRMLDCRMVNVIASRAGQELQRFFIETEGQSLREALVVRKKLESLGLMAGTIAHDFNNQLSAIIGHTELAMLELDASHPAHPLLLTAEQSMWRARDVVGDLLDFAGNTSKVPPASIVLNDIIQQAVSNLQADLDDNIRIETDLDPELPSILGRNSQLHQIISNLAINAVDAMSGLEGIIRIKTSVAPISAGERARCLTGNARNLPASAVLLEISDDGRGMDAEDAERMFDPFFSTKGVARGLGLSGVLGIARRLPAGLTFSSKEAEGTTFRLYFKPEITLANGGQSNISGEKEISQESKKRVLVVDDQHDVRRTVVMLLNSLGYEPHEAASGEEALRVAEKLPNLWAAVVDVVMPGLDGWETLEALHQVQPSMPAIMVSGYNQSQANRNRGEASGVTVLTKPFSRETLKVALQQGFQT